MPKFTACCAVSSPSETEIVTSLAPSSLVIAHLAWQWRLFRYFLRHVGSMTIVAGLCRAISQFSQLFALFIPLKIMLILGSGSLPTLMQLSPAKVSRGAWVIGLSIATIVLYVAAIGFELASNRIVGRGGTRLAQSLTESEHLSSEQRRQIREVFGTACRCYANGLVFAAGFIGLLLISPVVFALMMLILALQALMTNRLCAARGAGLAWLARAIARNPAEYLKYLASMNFLVVFGLLLLEYVIAGGLNSVVAILTLLLARRMFQSIGQFGVQAVQLERMHPDVVVVFFKYV
ncbi:hypothetical protein [Ferribacterium limneticum]|uniref:hypothetical protein n=1 Tax=Ferribacterium limneticum TaxID=76259 RepID=UPI001CFA2B4A|nr:hypothetical protein [Ferribacterium limneticum]UCV18274.1 hypothetical protein KI610_15930 [Ferribacterium limneticum]